jgi:hypothetical protein
MGDEREERWGEKEGVRKEEKEERIKEEEERKRGKRK